MTADGFANLPKVCHKPSEVQDKSDERDGYRSKKEAGTLRCPPTQTTKPQFRSIPAETTEGRRKIRSQQTPTTTEMRRIPAKIVQNFWIESKGERRQKSKPRNHHS